MPKSARSSRRVCALVLAVAFTVIGAAAPTAAAVAHGAASTTDAEEVATGWIWPVTPAVITRPFAAPAHAYGPGHRGVDVDASAASVIVAPAAGVVAFSGTIAGRGVVTIDHGDGLVTTLEPVDGAPPPGTAVGRGDAVGVPSVGGHTRRGDLHFGVRRDGDYVNPLALIGRVPRAVLLPCCS